MAYSLTKDKFLIAQEQEQVYEKLKQLELTHFRDAVLIELALKTGARASELIGKHGKAKGITPESLGEEIDEDGELIHYVMIEGLKGSNSRVVPIAQGLHHKLIQLAAGARPGECIFGISLRRFQQIWNKVRPVEKKLHSLRHTRAIEAYRATKDLKSVQTVLGHRNINNTMIYMNFFSSLKALKKIR